MGLWGDLNMSRKNYKIKDEESLSALDILNRRQDSEAGRMKRFLDMPDLSRTEGSPISELVKRIFNIERFKNFDHIQTPEVARADVSFDLFNFPPDHPARSKSDTYSIDDNHILRTHTTVMWHYYLQQPEIRSRILNLKSVGSLCHGKVYRKDEIDRNHMNVFHQMDGWYLCPKSEKIIGLEDLKEVLTEIAQAIFGKDIKYRFNVDQFPYTDPSCEMEVKIGDRWVEVLGSGVVRGSVLKNLGVDPEIYNGWAFGFGLERLAIISMELPDIRLLWSDDERVKKQLKLGNKFKEVSKFPPVIRDISFIVDKNFIPNDYFDLIRDIGGDMVEEVNLIDKYENVQKFEEGKLSYTFRITYRSLEKTLTNTEVNTLHAKLEKKTIENFKAEIRVD